MINIILNGKDKQLDDKTSIAQLLETLAMSEKRLAVEVNLQIVPRGDFAGHLLKEQDKVEIVQAIGGGSL